ncbi:preprotein translocase subunit SecY [Nitrosopumilus sp. b1]|uniref:preprotein translocase subunit SecY n=1 Tax=Nitrosopumilus sp. b1 TaxID=2109907 RepID=UPI000E2CB8A4|nr:preprotein translocase subunit SecY [Nitrosopumilus sp. b1]RDJ31572.1 MAG: preprotein translocase subunit SecY [Thermoproteota archaeon]KAF6243179.1 preprotein translocase subunit SecY [Nitrosopumilus sp. b1]RDJ33654.1 MAG: preprotein translocase subunit SecY [Thermoproteota archaeon]RDJ37232.1 MAG: preprotein translocase subunit SecY [Thermoproteota archaeon]RDJ39186.1 MAG: preprotein translocase subunit SecY [Thermoproteota archaeon]
MAEGSATAFIRKMVMVAEPYLPQVPKPKKKLPLPTRLLWCGLALLIYMIMGQTPLFGATTPEFDFLAFARVIFASQQGTLVELGIGPIVTAGLLMQLLRGSEILKFDFKKPEERGVFQTATKIVTYIVIVVESAVYGMAVYGPGISDPSVLYIIVGQLMAASVIIMFLDELIQKGWGLGSGISLFIMAGVAQQILWSLFSPLPAGDGGTVGILPYIGQSIMFGDLSNVFFRSNQLPSIFGILLTAAVLLILVYTQGMKVEIPIVSTKYRGFSAVYPIKLMYVSNIPVILASALTANAVFIGQMFWANFNPRNNNFFMNILAQFDPTSPSTPIGGILYYVTPPRGLDVAALDPMRAVGYVLFMIGIVVVFGRLWVELGGLSPKSAAQNLLDADVQVPGFRRSNKPVEALLNRYIPSVTIIGSMILGALAGISDVLGVFGSGIGILLMVDILINYYNQLVKEQVEVVMPRLGALLGRK